MAKVGSVLFEVVVVVVQVVLGAAVVEVVLGAAVVEVVLGAAVVTAVDSGYLIGTVILVASALIVEIVALVKRGVAVLVVVKMMVVDVVSRAAVLAG